MDNADPQDRKELLDRINALEKELALYAAKYGMTEETRRLFAKPAVTSLADRPDRIIPISQ